MVTVKECAAFARLATNEMVLGTTPSAAHRVLLSSYLLNLWRGPKTVRKMIVADIRMWLDFGMPAQASDLLIVLRQFLSDYPESRLDANLPSEITTQSHPCVATESNQQSSCPD
jgi:hypothetical protein